MMPSRETIEGLKKRYPEGTRVELVAMSDPYAPPRGTQGTVTGVDDIGSLLVHWDNGSGLNVLYGEDTVRIVKSKPIFKLVYQNGKEEAFETCNDAWQVITEMVLNHDLVWVDFHAAKAEVTRIRKGLYDEGKQTQDLQHRKETHLRLARERRPEGT